MDYINHKILFCLVIVGSFCSVCSVSGDRVFRPPNSFFFNVPPFLSDEKKEKNEPKGVRTRSRKSIRDRLENKRANKRASKRASKREDREIEGILKKLVQEKSKPVSFSHEMRSLLARQYSDLELTGKKVSLTLKDADIRDTIELVGKSVGINFLIDSDVKGVVRTVNFVDAPVSIVLQQILQGNVPKLALIKDCGLFRITRLEGARNILIDQQESDFEFAIIPILNRASTSRRKRKIEKMWRGIIGESLGRPGFYLVVDEDSKKIFCRAKRYHIAYFKKFLQEIDNLVPQVKIEARFVCAEKGFEENIGFQWSGIYNRRSSVRRGFEFVGAGQPLADISNNPVQQSAAGLVDWALNFVPTPDKIAKALSLPFVFGGNNLNTRRLNLLSCYHSLPKKPQLLLK